jgi:GH43 family beta-xylosidase
MTKDVVVVSDTNQHTFTRKVFKTVQELESYGYTVEIKFSTAEGRHDVIQFSALLHAYETE